MKINSYRVRLQHDNGNVYLTTTASSYASLVKVICKSENCPEGAIKSIIFKKTIYESIR